ncbi:GntR family transcriptional regulator [Marivita sp. S0852]|uniref:GntR family transcriptional regulator n=1 Tax=Marivita sp. S0852 TaxID=3373893 RepID=UPI00398244EC
MNELSNHDQSDTPSRSPEDTIAHAILTAVAEQRLPAGTKLREQSLSELFGCNRANVRRALTALAAQKVVELRPNRGAYVATPSPQEAREVFEARRTIERTLARNVVERASAEDIRFMRENIAQEAQARAANDKPLELRLSRVFHMKLAKIAGNRVLERFLGELTLQTTLILGLYSAAGTSACAEDEHARIVDEIEARNTDRLVILIDDHLRHLESGIDFNRPETRELTLAEQLAL